MTPFGARLRELRAARGMTLTALAARLAVSPAYLSALEHGKRGTPSRGLVHQICEVFDLIWDDAEALARLARLSRPRPRLDTAGLSPAQTALANRFADTLPHLSPATIAAITALIDATPPARPRRRRG
jgi:transcriptional regulator with XRE-family HTH domain